MNLAREATNELLYVGFNQDSGNFACGTTSGFVIYNVDPLRETFRRVFPNGGIGVVEMLFRCNLIAIVGGGRNPRYPTNKVMIWDDHQNKIIGELMFKSEVFAVKLRRDRIVVALNTKVYVYRFSDLKLLDQITTLPNPKGLLCLCPDAGNNVLAVPGLARGSIRVELYDIARATIIKAHDAELSQFALNNDGSRIASASEKGTLIRLWDCHTGDPLREFRRGMDRAEIYCIAFHPQGTFLACSSDKGTVHIFSLANPSANANGAPGSGAGATNKPPLPPAAGDAGFAGDDGVVTEQNKEADTAAANGANGTSSAESGPAEGVSQSSKPGSNATGAPGSAGAPGSGKDSGGGSNKNLGFSFLRGVLPAAIVPKYINSEWSFAQIHGIEGKSICAFHR